MGDTLWDVLSNLDASSSSLPANTPAERPSWSRRPTTVPKTACTATHSSPVLTDTHEKSPSLWEKKIASRNKLKPFVKVINYNHIMPTRYSVDIPVSKEIVNKDSLKDSTKKRSAKAHVKAAFEER